MKPSGRADYTHGPIGVEHEVLANILHYEVRKFRGRGKYDVTEHATLEEARKKRDELGGQTSIYAVGIIPSRGGTRGVCIVP